MNYWTELSVDRASQDGYLDELYGVYPITPNPKRSISLTKKASIKNAFDARDDKELIKLLLDLELFPIKDSYIAYLKKNREAIERNPRTINRIAANLYRMGYNEIIKKCTQPKETNRQIGPMFKRWVDSSALEFPVINDAEEFLNRDESCIYNASDAEMKNFANTYLGYTREKGVDFIAKCNNKYVVAEAKFLTAFGGHQNAQFEDALRIMEQDFSGKSVENEVVPIAIMDGVLYIRGGNKMYTYLCNHPEQTIISSLLLREFLFSL